MNTKPLKSLLQKGKDDQHIPPIAGTLFAIFLIIAIAGAIIGDGRDHRGPLGPEAALRGEPRDLLPEVRRRARP